MSSQQSSKVGLLVVVAVVVVITITAAVVIVGKSSSRQDEEARAQMRKIENALAIYKLKHGQFPERLEILVGFNLSREDIIDPWGQAYEYDPTRLNKSYRPFLRTAGAPGRNKPISSWD